MDEVDEILNQNNVEEEVEDEEDEELKDVEDANKEEDENEEEVEEEEEDNDDNDDNEDDDDDDDDDEENDEENDEDDDEDDEDNEDEEAPVDDVDEVMKDAEDGQDAEEEDESKMGIDNVKLTKTEKIRNYYSTMFNNSKLAGNYSISPTVAIPIQTHVNAITMSKALNYMFLGGSDGYIRKYDFKNSVDGKASLTLIQKHSLPESMDYAGITLSYWENEIPQKKSQVKLTKNNKEYEPLVSPVYSLEVQSEALYILSGLENGGITMQGVRYNEGTIAHYFKTQNSHQQAVNLLKLNNDETAFLSGSWDKKLLEWDLETGGIINDFKGVLSTPSSLEMRPLFSTVEVNDVVNSLKNDQIEQENNSSKEDGGDDDMDSLFGDDDEAPDKKENLVNPSNNNNNNNDDSTTSEDNNTQSLKSVTETNPLQEISKTTLKFVYDSDIFMTSGLNGNIDVWDRRIPTGPALSLKKASTTPPWCLSATWSADGDRIYAGRRNATVEEFDLKMPSKPLHTLKLPSISGPVSCVRAMPNNKHILCGSQDNVRLLNTKIAADPFFMKGRNAFSIVPGHHGGVISDIYIDPSCRFMVSASGNRGWQGNTTDHTLIYEIELQ